MMTGWESVFLGFAIGVVVVALVVYIETGRKE